MKKIRLLIVPLLVLPFVIGCDNAEKKNPKVTAEEFNTAINFEGVTRMQVSGIQTRIHTIGEPATSEICNETSELIYHSLSKQPNRLSETYARINEVGADKCEYTTRINEGEWDEPEEDESEGYGFTCDSYNPTKTVETFSAADSFEPELVYDNFNLVGDKYVYEGMGISNGSEVPVELNLKFEDKVLVYSYTYCERLPLILEVELSYQFKDIVPVWPILEI